MKISVFTLFSMMMLGTIMSSCLNNDDEGLKIIDTKDYIITVASCKLPGLITSSGINIPTSVYAIKKDGSNLWQQLAFIDGFNYEDGFQYELKINETSYIDYSMGEPAWTQYKLLEIINKVETDSENLPESFITGKEYVYYPISISYKIEATQKELIEEDLINNSNIPCGGSFVIGINGSNIWTLFDKLGNIKGSGEYQISKIEDVPTLIQDFLPEGSISGIGNWIFTYYMNENEYENTYFAVITDFISELNNANIWLYKDWTLYYQEKYPEAGVNEVICRFSLLD